MTILGAPSRKKQLAGALLLSVAIALFFTFNRIPKLDIVGEDLDAVTAPQEQCFQGFCIEREAGTSFVTRWWTFSGTYLRLVTVGMVFAFLVAGIAEAFLFPSGAGRWFQSGGVFSRTLKGAAIGPVMNLCSACIVPVSSAFHKRARLEGSIAMVQGSATMNIPALVMAFSVFTPLLGLSRLLLALVGSLLIGPIVVATVRRDAAPSPETPIITAAGTREPPTPAWGPPLREAFRDWARTSIGYLLRMGPVMVLAGFASGLAIQWLSPATVTTYLGNDLAGIAIAATFGILINVPLLFEIPLVALLLLLGMGTAPAATLLFTAAAGGPVTFWGLAKIMPRRAIATFAAATWLVGASGGVAVLAIGSLIWESGGLGPRVASAAEAPEAGHLGRGDGLSSGGDLEEAPSPADPSQYRSLLFADATESAGLDFLHHPVGSDLLHVAGGVAVLDFNGDDLQDIYFTDSNGPNALYRNNGDGSFIEVAASAGVDDPLGLGNGACAADYDGDGDRDLYVTNYGPSKLFRNGGDGTFLDVSAGAGVDDPDTTLRSAGCAWGDYDRDGFLDMIVVRHMDQSDPGLLVNKTFSEAVRALALYHNNGDGTFRDATQLLGDTSGPASGERAGYLGNVWGAGFQPGWTDFDNDGDLDLYVVNDFGRDTHPNVLWRNDGPAADGDWTFTDISRGSDADVRVWGMALAVGDYDLDGDLDFFITNIGNNVLLRNNGDGKTFTDVTHEARAGKGMVGLAIRFSWGAMFFDHDNDGDEDLYVVSGFLEGGKPDIDVSGNPELQPNVLLDNMGDGSFKDVSLASGADDPGIGHGGSYLDFNNDGCLDLVISNYGQRARLFQNRCVSGNNWLAVSPKSVTANRDGIGARITVVSGERTQIREVSSGSSHMSQNMLAAHFGLGEASVADTVTIRWPSGKVQILTDVAANQRLTVAEPR